MLMKKNPMDMLDMYQPKKSPIPGSIPSPSPSPIVTVNTNTLPATTSTPAPAPVAAPQPNPTAQVDFNQYKTQSATIDDIAKKYGFDYSRDYAKRQAEAEAQAKRNAVLDSQRKNSSNKDINLKSIDNNLMNTADSLDRNYFQKYMQQAQNQTNNGLNAGIAADQDLRLGMARQAEMGAAYRDANLGRMQENSRFTNEDLRLAESLGLINSDALAREDGLYNDRLQQAFQNVQAINNFNQSDNLAAYQGALQQRGQNIGMDQYNKTFDYNAGRDKIGDARYADETAYNHEQDAITRQAQKEAAARAILESDRTYNYGVSRDKVTDQNNKRDYSRQVSRDKRSDFENDRTFGLSKSELAQREKATTQSASAKVQIAQIKAGQAVTTAKIKAAQSAAKAKAKSTNIKPMSKANSYNQGITYWADIVSKQKKDGNFQGAVKIEQEILSNPTALKEIATSGYDINSFLDALYATSSNGQFKTKKDYLSWWDKTNKQQKKTIEENKKEILKKKLLDK
jgi:hypothetical protein